MPFACFFQTQGLVSFSPIWHLELPPRQECIVVAHTFSIKNIRELSETRLLFETALAAPPNCVFYLNKASPCSRRMWKLGGMASRVIDLLDRCRLWCHQKSKNCEMHWSSRQVRNGFSQPQQGVCFVGACPGCSLILLEHDDTIYVYIYNYLCLCLYLYLYLCLILILILIFLYLYVDIIYSYS